MKSLSRRTLVHALSRGAQLTLAASLLTDCGSTERKFSDGEAGNASAQGGSRAGGAGGGASTSKGGTGSVQAGGNSSNKGGSSSSDGGLANGGTGDVGTGGEAPTEFGGAGGTGGGLAGGTSSMGGASQGGTSQGGASQGGTAGKGGASQGGTAGKGGASQGGASQGGASQGGSSAKGGTTGAGGTAGCTTRCNETGTACTTPNQCKSGLCVDGMCCESACDGICEACSGALTGAADGACAAVKRGTDPGNDCAATDVSTCGLTGMCANRACALYDNTAVCKAASCATGTAKSEQKCDGAGVCKAATSTPCAPFVCGTNACLGTCAKNADCSSGNVCVATACQAPSPLLGACDEAADCARGDCISQKCGLSIKSIRVTGTEVSGGGDPHASLDGWFKTDANGHNLVRVSTISTTIGRLWASMDMVSTLTTPLPPNNYLVLTDAESSNMLSRTFQFNLSDGTAVTKTVSASSSDEIVLYPPIDVVPTGDPFMLFQWTGATVNVLSKTY